MGRVSRTVKRLANDPSAGSRPFLNLRLTSIRTWIIGSILVILILLLGAAILTSMAFSRIDGAITTAEEAQERANTALEVGKAAADLHAALAQGTVMQDPDEFTQTVRDGEQALLSAEERLTEDIDSLPQDDPMRVTLDRLDTSTTNILILADDTRREAEAGRWWLVESLVTAGMPQYRDMMTESVEQMQVLTAERQVAAAAEAEAARRLMQVIPAALVLAVVIVTVGAAFITIRSIALPVERLAEAAGRLATGHLEERVSLGRVDEFARLATAFNSMANEIVGMVSTLEQRIAERTRGLQATVEVSRAITSVLDPDELLQRVVDLARDRLGLYYVGLFLVDEERRYAVLRAGTGEAGHQMMEQGHQLEIGGQSMIGQCVSRDEARIALDVGEEAVRFDNPFLPETRSEMALPLRARGQVIGAMTVQSTEEAAFDETNVAVLQAMADQVAVALDNARLFVNAQAAVERMEATHRRYLGRTWSEYLQPAKSTSYEAVRPGATRKSDDSALAASVVLRGTTIGALDIRDDDATRQWSEDEIALVEAVAERLGLAAENLRLIEETQRRAAFDRLVGQVTARMRETLDLDTMLRTAAQEVRQALDLPEVVVQLTPRAMDGEGDGEVKQPSEIPYRGPSSDGGNDA